MNAKYIDKTDAIIPNNANTRLTDKVTAFGDRLLGFRSMGELKHCHLSIVICALSLGHFIDWYIIIGTLSLEHSHPRIDAALAVPLRLLLLLLQEKLRVFLLLIHKLQVVILPTLQPMGQEQGLDRLRAIVIICRDWRVFLDRNSSCGRKRRHWEV